MSTQPRTLRSYLLLPRPKDAVKWWILPLTFAVGVITRGGVTNHGLARAALVWAALELLVYQARYQWNDIRGFEADQRHPDSAGRGRLPGPLAKARQHIAASAGVAVARVAAAGVLALALPGFALGWTLVILTVAVFGVAAAYEALRAVGTGRGADVPAPLTPAVVAIWFVIGGGYAIRGVTGLALAVPLLNHPAVAVCATVTMWAFGISFVTARWAVEALAFARAGSDGLRWELQPGHAREHLLALVRWLPEWPAGVDPQAWTACRGRTTLRAPWNTSAVVAAAAAGTTGALLAGAAPLIVCAAALAAGCAALAVLLVPTAWMFGTAGLGLVGLAALAGIDTPSAALPWLGVLGALLWFRLQSLQTMSGAFRKLVLRRGMEPMRA